MHHLGRPLSQYLFPSSLGTQGSSQGGQLDLSAGSQDVDLSRSTPVSGHVSSQPNVAESSRRRVSVSTSCDTFIVDAILSFVKAYCLKGDKNSLKIKIGERFSGASISAAKNALGFLCASS